MMLDGKLEIELEGRKAGEWVMMLEKVLVVVWVMVMATSSLLVTR